MIKPVFWMGSSRKDLRSCPNRVQQTFGYAIYLAQAGGKHRKSSPLKGYGGASVIEIIEDFDGNTYRAIYTTRIRNAVYVLHVFQKKSKRGIATPSEELAVVNRRLAEAVRQAGEEG